VTFTASLGGVPNLLKRRFSLLDCMRCCSSFAIDRKPRRFADAGKRHCKTCAGSRLTVALFHPFHADGLAYVPLSRCPALPLARPWVRFPPGPDKSPDSGSADSQTYSPSGEAQARVVSASTIAALMATTYSTATIAGQSKLLVIQKVPPRLRCHSRSLRGPCEFCQVLRSSVRT